MSLTGEEVAKHNSKASCGVIVHGKVRDWPEFTAIDILIYSGVRHYRVLAW
jgi:regulator of RNase E activity RraA